MKVRDAVLEDFPWLVRQLGIFWGTLPFSRKVEYDPVHAHGVIETMMRTGLLLVAVTEEGQLMGTLGAWKMAHPFAPGVETYSEAFWWVDREWRGGGAGSALAAEYVTRKILNKVPWATISLETGSPVREESLSRLGFRLMERTYVRED